MLSIAEALREVLVAAEPLQTVQVPLRRSGGRVLAEEIRADLDLPPFDKALMDGYAIRSKDLAGSQRRLRIGETITAGRMPTRPLATGEAAIITTGAPLPEGADCVVMHEKTQTDGEWVLLKQPEIRPGQNLLPRGTEMKAGEVVLAPGAMLNPARIGVLASVGRNEVNVIPSPRVAIVPTGDELVEIDHKPGPGQIRNSNTSLLEACVLAEGAEAAPQPIALDEPERLGEILAAGLAFDILLVTGGVSAGHLDLVPDTLARLDVTRVFHKVQLKPGKPLWFGVGPRRDDQPGALVFGLPGNPVSGLVCFHLFVRPVIRKLSGQPVEETGTSEGALTRSFQQRGERPTYFPARLIAGAGTPKVEPLNWAGSADLRTVAEADGFAIFPAGDREFAVGEIVRFLSFR